LLNNKLAVDQRQLAVDHRLAVGDQPWPKGLSCEDEKTID
jgi:hypothetical protein